MKKKILAVLCVVVMTFNCLAFPALAVTSILSSVGVACVAAVTWVCSHIVEDIDTAIWNEVKSIVGGLKPSKVTEVDRLVILGYWDDIISSSGIDETAFRTLIGGITSEEYYWMFADCNCSIDDICDYVYRTSDKSGEAFETVKTFANDSGFTEDDLRVFHDLVYTHRTDVYDFTSDTMRYGITIDDICDYCFNDSGVAVDNPTTGVDTNGNVTVSGETFSEICDRLAAQYAPKADTEFISWRTTTSPNNWMLPIYQYGKGLVRGTDTCYFQPFYVNANGDYYFSNWQYKLTLTDFVISVAGKDYFSTTTTDFVDLSPKNGSLSISTYPYISLRPYPRTLSGTNNVRTMMMYAFKTYEDYINNDYDNNWTAYSEDLLHRTYYSAADTTQTVLVSAITEELYEDPVDGDIFDAGYFVSDEPIEMTGLIDPIPVENLKDTMVTLAGDTIYDYTITNNTTGDTSSVEYFVTNNYTYENTYNEGGDSGSSDGGSTSGDVNVGGKVDVSGDIEVGGKVDININVEQGSGSTEDIKGYEYEEINLEEALEQIPEMSTGFTNWFSRVFSFLPPELMGLLLGGIAIAILLRIAGR